ncbi:MAG: hypothetical protein H0W53_14340 [Acidobacteria bacterium]|nr:hypothetical protein [Acidobacteriota bacterium]
MTTLGTAHDPETAARLAHLTGEADPGLNVSDVTVRPTPRRAWTPTIAATLVLTVIALAGWEAKMRSLGLAAGDLDDSNDHWAMARRSLAVGSTNKIAIVGDSRIWFDTDLAVWEEMTGMKPVQLALEGTNGRYLLTDLARDESFRGLVVVGLADALFFGMPPGLRGVAVERAKTQSYSQRFGVVLHRQLSRWFAFLEQMYTPQRLFRWMDLPSRPGVVPPARLPWKLAETFDDRQTFMWPRVERDLALRDGTRMTWMGMFRFVLPPVTDDVLQTVVDDAVRDVRAIRARGGEIVFIRPPSSGALLEAERVRLPRAKGWDRLIRETGTVGIHWEDHANMQGLDVPEWSHLTRESATRFTRAYVDALVGQVPWLQSRAGQWRRSAPVP